MCECQCQGLISAFRSCACLILSVFAQNCRVPQTSSPEWYVTTELEHQRGTQNRLSVDIFHTSTGKIPKETEEMSVHRGFPTLKDTQQLCSVIFDVETILDKKDYCIVEPIPGSSNGR